MNRSNNRKINELFVGGHVPYRLLIPDHLMMHLVGPNCYILNTISQQTGVSMSFFEGKIGNQQDNVLYVAGAVPAAKKEAMVSLLKYLQTWSRNQFKENGQNCLSCLVPADSVQYMLMSSRGDFLHRLIAEHGNNLQLLIDDKTVSYHGFHDRPVIVKSRKIEHVASGITEINELVDRLYVYKHLTEANFVFTIRLPSGQETDDTRVSKEPLLLSSSTAPLQPSLKIEKKKIPQDSADAATGASSSIPKELEKVRNGSSPIRLLVDKNHAAWIIGSQGQRKRTIERLTGVSLKISSQSMPITIDDAEDRLLELRGPLSSKYRAISYILKGYSERNAPTSSTDTAEGMIQSGLAPPASSTEPDTSTAAASSSYSQFLRLLVPQGALGYLIGQGGQTIQQLEKSTGTHLHVKKTENQNASIYRIISVRGTPNLQATAAITVTEKIDEWVQSQQDTNARAPGGGSYAANTEFKLSDGIKSLSTNNSMNQQAGGAGPSAIMGHEKMQQAQQPASNRMLSTQLKRNTDAAAIYAGHDTSVRHNTVPANATDRMTQQQASSPLLQQQSRRYSFPANGGRLNSLDSTYTHAPNKGWQHHSTTQLMSSGHHNYHHNNNMRTIEAHNTNALVSSHSSGSRAEKDIITKYHRTSSQQDNRRKTVHSGGNNSQMYGRKYSSSKQDSGHQPLMVAPNYEAATTTGGRMPDQNPQTTPNFNAYPPSTVELVRQIAMSTVQQMLMSGSMPAMAQNLQNVRSRIPQQPAQQHQWQHRQLSTSTSQGRGGNTGTVSNNTATDIPDTFIMSPPRQDLLMQQTQQRLPSASFASFKQAKTSSRYRRQHRRDGKGVRDELRRGRARVVLASAKRGVFNLDQPKLDGQSTGTIAVPPLPSNEVCHNVNINESVGASGDAASILLQSVPIMEKATIGESRSTTTSTCVASSRSTSLRDTDILSNALQTVETESQMSSKDSRLNQRLDTNVTRETPLDGPESEEAMMRLHDLNAITESEKSAPTEEEMAERARLLMSLQDVPKIPKLVESNESDGLRMDLSNVYRETKKLEAEKMTWSPDKIRLHNLESVESKRVSANPSYAEHTLSSGLLKKPSLRRAPLDVFGDQNSDVSQISSCKTEIKIDDDDAEEFKHLKVSPTTTTSGIVVVSPQNARHSERASRKSRIFHKDLATGFHLGADRNRIRNYCSICRNAICICKPSVNEAQSVTEIHPRDKRSKLMYHHQQANISSRVQTSPHRKRNEMYFDSGTNDVATICSLFIELANRYSLPTVLATSHVEDIELVLPDTYQQLFSNSERRQAICDSIEGVTGVCMKKVYNSEKIHVQLRGSPLSCSMAHLLLHDFNMRYQSAFRNNESDTIALSHGNTAKRIRRQPYMMNRQDESQLHTRHQQSYFIHSSNKLDTVHPNCVSDGRRHFEKHLSWSTESVVKSDDSMSPRSVIRDRRIHIPIVRNTSVNRHRFMPVANQVHRIDDDEFSPSIRNMSSPMLADTAAGLDHCNPVFNSAAALTDSQSVEIAGNGHNAESDTIHIVDDSKGDKEMGADVEQPLKSLSENCEGYSMSASLEAV